MSKTINFKTHIKENLSQLQGKRVLIFGDVGVDEYVMGDIYRISPEAPVPVVDVTSKTEKMGLSANVAANVKSLGGDPVLVSVVGEDPAAETLKSLLRSKEIATDHLIAAPLRPTTAKTRVMSGQHHIVRVDSENRNPVDAQTQKNLDSQIRDLMGSCDAVILQDYAKGMISREASQSLIAFAKREGKKVLVDPYRSTPLAVYKGADVMTPNRDEAVALGMQISPLLDSENIDKLGAELMEAISSPQMVITLGSKGMKIFNSGQATEIPTFARKVFDVTGAGDTVISAFALGLAAGWSLEMSGYLANLAAGVVVGHIGAVACSVEALKMAIDKQS